MNILSTIQAAGALFAGYGTLTLGPVMFTKHELPPSMPIGGQHALTVKKFPGGAREINTMGLDHSDIAWSGYFVGQDASTRVRLMYAMLQSGQPVTLAWDVYSYVVVLLEFTAETQISGSGQRYRVSCTVQQDNTQATGTTAVDLVGQVTQDLVNGNPLGALSAVSQGVVTGPVSAATDALGVPNATSVGSAAYGAAVTAVNSAATALQSAAGTADAALAPYGVTLASASQAAGIGLDTTGMAAGILAAVSSAGDIANLSQAAGFVGRAVTNLANASA